ncbi:uncharacterized protein LOC135842310 [Planococcus citri]|uniref:uncharacterized protein LOC135842310 n=1 Tax=Planococcus citri TaxID=170843 RepID=UPI0031F8A0DE
MLVNFSCCKYFITFVYSLMASLNAFWCGLIIFTVGCNVLFINSQNNAYDDNKHQRKSISRFFKSVAKIITRHGIDVGVVGSNITELLNDDPHDIYKCGQRLIKFIESLNKNKKNALTNQEKDQIEADFCNLVSWISMCDTYNLWTGEFGGGSICAAILKSSGTDPVAILGAKDDDPIRNITY